MARAGTKQEIQYIEFLRDNLKDIYERHNKKFQNFKMEQDTKINDLNDLIDCLYNELDDSNAISMELVGEYYIEINESQDLNQAFQEFKEFFILTLHLIKIILDNYNALLTYLDYEI